VQGIEIESCKVVFLWGGGQLLFTCSESCCRTYCLATLCDRQPMAEHTACSSGIG